MSSQKIASYAAAAMLIVGVVYFMRNAPDAKTSNKARAVTGTTKEGSLTTTPIQTSAVAVIGEPLAAIMARFRNVASLILPSKVDQGRTANPFAATGGSVAVQRAAYTAPLRPEYRAKALAGGPANVIYLPGNTRPQSNL